MLSGASVPPLSDQLVPTNGNLKGPLTARQPDQWWWAEMVLTYSDSRPPAAE